MAILTLPERDYLRDALDYDPAHGEFWWRIRPREHFPTARQSNIWNSRHAGNHAGTVHPLYRYRIIRLDKINYRAHRLAFLLVYGEPVPDELDHIDGDRLNNRIDNLRSATRSQNNANANPRASRSGTKGVFKFHDGRWRASVVHNGRNHYLGTFSTLEEASEARRIAAERIHGQFARHD